MIYPRRTPPPSRDTLRQLRRATRKSDPYKRPATSPALTPYMRGEIDTVLARLKEFAITYSLEKDRACKNPHYITDATTATLAALEKNILTTCRKYGQLHRIASADVSTPHTRE